MLSVTVKLTRSANKKLFSKGYEIPFCGTCLQGISGEFS